MARKKRRTAAAAAPKPPPEEWLHAMSLDELQVCCVDLDLRPADGVEECRNLITSHPRWVGKLSRAHKTKAFATALKVWREAKAMGSTEVLLEKDLWWVYGMTDAEAKMMCYHMGLPIDGDRTTLLRRLEAHPQVNKFMAYLATPQWKSRLANADTFYDNYKPDLNAQYMFSHVPTENNRRDEWLAER